MLFSFRRTLCYVLVFDQIDIIKKSLDFLSQQADELDIVVIENPSKNTPQIKQFVDELGAKHLIKRYYLFDKNITGFAFSIVFNNELKLIKKSRFVLLTDGDLTVENKRWLNEEISILKSHKDVLACGVSLNMSNLPVNAFPEAKNWIPDDINQQSDYIEALTGAHLLLFRGRQLSTFMSWWNGTDKAFVDGIFHNYCYDIAHKKWARTKTATAYHLTWDLYSDKNHPYTKLKTQKSFQETWHHKTASDFKLTEY